MRFRPLSLTTLLVVMVAVASFAISRQFARESDTQAEAPTPTSIDVDALAKLLQEDAAKPRFNDELLGIYIAPDAASFPALVRQAQDALVAAGCTNVSPDRAGDLAYESFPVLPGLSGAQTEPEVIACGEKVTGVNYEYQGTGINGLPSTVLVARSVSPAWGFDAAADRVGVEQVAGRSIIVARAVTPDGTGQTSVLIIPERFGLTAVHAFNLSSAELNTVGEILIRLSQ